MKSFSYEIFDRGETYIYQYELIIYMDGSIPVYTDSFSSYDEALADAEDVIVYFNDLVRIGIDIFFPIRCS